MSVSRRPGGQAMTTVAGRFSIKQRHPDLLSGTPRAHPLDRWIFVFTALWFIAIVLAGSFRIRSGRSRR